MNQREPLGYLLYVMLATTVLTGTWKMWPDLLIDAGYYLYNFWQLSEGKVLFRDITYYYGPFSPYLNAALFRVFGASLTTVILFNFLLVNATGLLIYKIFTAACDRMTGMLAALLFLTIFAFSQYVPIGNYNFIAPYKTEALHGTLATVLMIWLLFKVFTGNRQGKVLFMIGVCTGISLLTSAELTLATVATLAGGLLLIFCHERPDRAEAGRVAGWILAGSVMPVAAFFGFFLLFFPPGQALAVTLNGILAPLLFPDVARNTFFPESMGFDLPKENFLTLAKSAGWIVTVAALVWTSGYLAGRKFSIREMSGKRIGVALLLPASAAAVLISPPVPWEQLVRSYPVLVAVITVTAAVSLLRNRLTHLPAASRFLLAVWGVYALFLLPKMLLSARIHHYGFYLGMPATMLVWAALLWGLPRIRRGAPNWLVHWVFCAALAGFAVFWVRTSLFYFQQKDFIVGKGGDAVVTYGPQVSPKGILSAAALQWLEGNAPEGATLLTLPEGTIFNYLARRERPSPYTFIVTEVLAHGEQTIVDSFARGMPDFLLLVDRDLSEFGYQPFGQDRAYGKTVMEWVRQNYTTRVVLGAPPFVSNDFGIEILSRNAPGSSGP
jgi:hypothetical protein